MFVFIVEWDFTIKEPKERLAFQALALRALSLTNNILSQKVSSKFSLSSKKCQLLFGNRAVVSENSC